MRVRRFLALVFILALSAGPCAPSTPPSSMTCDTCESYGPRLSRSEIRVLKLEKLLGDTQKEVFDTRFIVQQLVAVEAQNQISPQLTDLNQTLIAWIETTQTQQSNIAIMQAQLSAQASAITALNQSVTAILANPSTSPSVSPSVSILPSGASESSSVSSSFSQSSSRSSSSSPSPSPSLSPSSSPSPPSPFTFRGNVVLTGSDQGAALLRNMTRVEGNITVVSSTLLTLSLFEKLKEITGSLVIKQNPNLASLAALSSLQSIGGDLLIWKNLALTSLNGLDSLTSVNGSVQIASNPQLLNVSGLASLTNVVGSLSLSNNQNLSNILGLNSLTSVGGDLLIERNNALVNLTGFNSLVNVGGSFRIYSNDLLRSIDIRTRNVMNIANALTITYNSELQSANVSVNSTGSLTVSDNSNLRTVLVDTLQLTGDVYMTNNAQTYPYPLLTVSFPMLRACKYLSLIGNLGLTSFQTPMLQTVEDSLYLGSNFFTTTGPNIVNMTSLALVKQSVNINYNMKLMNLDFLSSLAPTTGSDVAVGGSVNVGGAIVIERNGVNCVNWNYVPYTC